MSHNYDYNKNYVPLAQELRKNMTKEERRLWYQCLSLLPITAHRQKNIGNYIVDFYIPDKSIVIELDGSQHSEQSAAVADMIRDCYMREHGITVLRYKNALIRNCFTWVVKDILKHLDLDSKDTYDYMRAKYRKKKGYADQ